MPWKLHCALLIATGCSFHAAYESGSFLCSDGVCPSGLVCDAERRCVTPAMSPDDAAQLDAPTDAPNVVHALTCADPGDLADASGTTARRQSEIAAMCGGFVMNAPDAVYRLVPAAAAAAYRIEITGVKAYVIPTCTPFASCAGNVAAAPGAPITFTAPSTAPVFIVVDHDNPATTASYELTVTRL